MLKTDGRFQRVAELLASIASQLESEIVRRYAEWVESSAILNGEMIDLDRESLRQSMKTVAAELQP